MRAGKAHLAGPPAELPPSLAAAVRSGRRTMVLVGGLLLGCLVLYVMWPRNGYGYGYDGVEETEHFVSVSGTQVSPTCHHLCPHGNVLKTKSSAGWGCLWRRISMSWACWLYALLMYTIGGCDAEGNMLR